MSDVDQIEFNTRAFADLKTILAIKKIPNALLFYGRKNTRKKEAAFSFSKGANCHGDGPLPCDQCGSCRKIQTGNHPDIHTIKLIEGKKSIAISQIRDIAKTLSNKPNEARTRVVMIVDADLMNVQAQNALLKLLEEPPEKTCFILMAQKESRLLPTVLSRCRKILFKPLTQKMVEDQLIHFHNIDPETARIAAGTADSDLNKALLWLNPEPDKSGGMDWMKTRKWLIRNLVRLVKADGMPVSSGLFLSEKLSRSPEHIDDVIAVIKSFFRDLTVFNFSPEKIVNLDFSDTFANIIQYRGLEKIFFWQAALYETEKRLISNSGLRLTMDAFFLKLACN